jgi:hypothetical protein
MILIIMFAAGIAALATAQRNAPGREPADGIDRYALLRERNIFNPNRRSRPPQGEREEQREAPPRRESIRMVGTLVADGRAVAFFEGEDDGPRRTGDRIAGMRITEIETTGIVVVHDEKAVTWPVGAALERSGDGPWKLDASESTTKATDGAESSPSGGSAEDILKRLRARRSQELENE